MTPGQRVEDEGGYDPGSFRHGTWRVLKAIR
jgi:hypothetical protein